MFNTIELRWFYPGELPAEVLNWFNGLGSPLNSSDSRTDIYLQPVTADVGVKLRQGNFELKYRQQQLGSLSIAKENAPIGQVETWSKWICADDLPDRLTPAKIAERSGWVRVEKVRYQRWYRVEFDRGCHLTAIAAPQDGATAIEVTGLKVFDRAWWTIACEYLGDNLQLEEQFQVLVASLLDDCPLPRSTTAMSCGYPQWLMEIR